MLKRVLNDIVIYPSSLYYIKLPCCNRQHFLSVCWTVIYFKRPSMQEGQIWTLVQYGPVSLNLISYFMPVSFMKIWLKLNGLWYGQVQIWTFSTQGQVALGLMVRSGQISKSVPRFYGCPGYQQVWWWSDKKMRALLCPQHFFHYKSMEKMFGAQGQLRSEQSQLAPNQTRPRFYVLVTCKFEEDLIKKMKVILCPQHFPHYKSTGAFGCRGNQSFDPIGPKSAAFPHPMMLHIKFDQDWPTCLISKTNLHKCICPKWISIILGKGCYLQHWLTTCLSLQQRIDTCQSNSCFGTDFNSGFSKI